MSLYWCHAPSLHVTLLTETVVNKWFFVDFGFIYRLHIFIFDRQTDMFKISSDRLLGNSFTNLQYCSLGVDKLHTTMYFSK